jgi:predicted transglutaminase-like cysteine proteinase
MNLLRPVLMTALLVPLPFPALANGQVPRCGPMQLEVSRIGPPPSQYAAFCEIEPTACELDGPSVVEWTAVRHGQLQDVNRRVNEEIEFVSDMDHLGLEEDWSFPVDCRGDCEDFVLEKRERLVAIGWPRSTLTIAFAFHEVQFFPHAVLLAETTAGTWVLDNLYDEVLCWDEVPYRYSRRERPDGLWTRFRR